MLRAPTRHISANSRRRIAALPTVKRAKYATARSSIKPTNNFSHQLGLQQIETEIPKIAIIGDAVEVRTNFHGVSSQNILNVLTNFEEYNNIFSCYAEQPVTEWDPKSGEGKVSFSFLKGIATINEFKVSENDDGCTLSWKMSESESFAHNSGSWELKDTVNQGRKTTEVTYKHSFKLKNWLLSKLVTKSFITSIVKSNIDELASHLRN